MTCSNPVLAALTVQDFKDLFFRDFPYLPVWITTELYNTDAEVYYETNKLFYRSLVDGNTGLIPPDNATEWVKYSDDINNYILDADIEKAYSEACASINSSIYSSDDNLVQAYLYLTAHYLTQDIITAQSGVQSTGSFAVTSRSVGSVSESYAIPDRFLKSPILSYYTKSGYGQKYLNLTYPKIIGNVVSVYGRSTAR